MWPLQGTDTFTVLANGLIKTCLKQQVIFQPDFFYSTANVGEHNNYYCYLNTSATITIIMVNCNVILTMYKRQIPTMGYKQSETNISQHYIIFCEVGRHQIGSLCQNDTDEGDSDCETITTYTIRHTSVKGVCCIINSRKN